MPQQRSDLRLLAVIASIVILVLESFWAWMGTAFMGSPNSWYSACFLYAGLLTIPAFLFFAANNRFASWVAAAGTLLADIGLTIQNLRDTPDAPVLMKFALPFLGLVTPQVLAPLIMAALLFPAAPRSNDQGI